MKISDEKIYFDKTSINSNSFNSQEIVFGLTNAKPFTKKFASSNDNMYKYQSNNIENIANTELKTASAGKRFLNYILDLISFYIFSYLFGIYLGICSAIFGFDILWLNNMGFAGNYLFGFILLIVFYMFFEGFFAVTPGKLITGTKIVTESGKRPTFLNILNRTLCRFIPFEAFSFLSDSAIGWHDTISKTRVVKKEKRK